MRTHTYAELPVSQATFDEIAAKLKAAGYDHAFDILSYDGIGCGGTIDMHGIGLTIEEPDRFESLFGSDILPSYIFIGNENVQLGDVVRCGFEMTRMTVKQWNKMDSRLRDAILAHAIAVMKEEA